MAALLGQAAAVRQLIAADPALLSARNMFGVSAVHAAHYGGQDAVLDALGSTALHGAAYWGQHEAADVLLEAGADPNAISRDSFLQIAPLGSAVATTPGDRQPSDDEDVVLGPLRQLPPAWMSRGRRRPALTSDR